MRYSRFPVNIVFGIDGRLVFSYLLPGAKFALPSFLWRLQILQFLLRCWGRRRSPCFIGIRHYVFDGVSYPFTLLGVHLVIQPSLLGHICPTYSFCWPGKCWEGVGICPDLVTIICIVVVGQICDMSPMQSLGSLCASRKCFDSIDWDLSSSLEELLLTTYLQAAWCSSVRMQLYSFSACPFCSDCPQFGYGFLCSVFWVAPFLLVFVRISITCLTVAACYALLF